MRTTSSNSSETMPMLFLLASLLLRPATAASNTSCGPVSCGNLTISYPFSLAGVQPLYCGYPPFALTCDNATTPRRAYLSNTFRERLFRVDDIFYANNSMVVAFVGDGGGCPVPDFNVTASLALFPFAISGTNWRLVLFHGCTVPPGLRLPLPCGDRTVGAYISGRWDEGEGGGTLPPGVSRNCTSVSVPVRGGITEPDRRNYEQLIADGFLVELLPALGDCDACRRMRGECRFDQLSFQCVCPDGKLCPNFAQSNSSTHSDKSNFRLKICTGIATALLCLVVLSIVCIVHNVRRKRKRSASLDNLIIRESSMLASPKKFALTESPLAHIFSYEELDEATDSFSDARVLGAGGFGTVYKGILRDGSVLAVKRLYRNSYKGVEQFANEVDILSRLRHPNLVAFYGCTSSSLGSCCRDLLLAYEFVPNGTLANHLNCDGEAPFLLWPTRLGIAVEAAGALAYLHAHQIVHRDIKTSNILLDEDFHVKVADFGLSRLFPPDATHVSTAPQGTPGYVDPAYHHMYHLTDKSDVYSFGVVLVELISSRPAVDMSQIGTDVNLASMAVRMIQCCEIDKLVDPRLGYKSASETMKTVDLVAEVAFRCLQPEQEVRPSMSEVLDVLREAHQTMMEKGGCGAKDDDTLLLKKSRDGSPDSVMHQWISPSTTSNYST